MTICVCQVMKSGITLGTDSGTFTCEAYIVRDTKKLFESDRFAYCGTGCEATILAFWNFLKSNRYTNIQDTLDSFLKLHESRPDKEMVKDITFYVVDKEEKKAYKVNNLTLVTEIEEGKTDMIGCGVEIANTLYRLNYSMYNIIKNVALDCVHVHGEPQVITIEK